MTRGRTRLLRVLAALVLLMPALLAALPPELERYFQAIRQRESAGHPWSIFDNTAHLSYRLGSRAEAEALARELIARGHNLDVGLFQLNWRWQGRRPNLTLDNVFDPAVNETVARTILAEFHAAARAVYTNTEDAIRMAVGAYNNGKVRVHNPAYVNGVFRLAGRTPPYAVNGDAPPPTAWHSTAHDEATRAGSDVALPNAARRRAAVASFDDDVAPEPAEDPPPVDELLPALLVAIAAMAALAITLLAGLKWLPWLLTGSGSLARRAVVLAALRARQQVAAQAARLVQRP